MASEANPNTAHTPQQKLHELIPPQKLFPDEDPVVFQGLRSALLQDLVPVSAYERVLAENLVSLEWESLRCRNRRDALIWAEYRTQAINAFQDGLFYSFLATEPDPKAKALGFDLVGSDPEKRTVAESKLAELEISPTELLAKAWASVARLIDPLERMLAEIEPRRRKLRADYDRLIALSVLPINDFDVLPA